MNDIHLTKTTAERIKQLLNEHSQPIKVTPINHIATRLKKEMKYKQYLNKQ